MTAAAWIKPDALPSSGNFGYIVSKGWNGSTESFTLRLRNNGGTHSIDFASYNGSDHWAVLTKTLATGVWHHVLGTYDGSMWKLYYNGNLAASSSDATGPLNNNESVWIGASNVGGVTRLFDGQIDDVRLYKYPATDTQAKLIYNEGAAIRFGPASGAP
jgi:hypothetical protein